MAVLPYRLTVDRIGDGADELDAAPLEDAVGASEVRRLEHPHDAVAGHAHDGVLLDEATSHELIRVGAGFGLVAHPYKFVGVISFEVLLGKVDHFRPS